MDSDESRKRSYSRGRIAVVEGLPILIALSDLEAWPDSVQQLCQLCSEARSGSVAVVLRDRELSLRKRLKEGEVLRATTLKTGQLLFVSERADLARCLGADGVHLPSKGLLPSLARLAGAKFVTSAGHGFSALSEGEKLAINAVLLSPVCAPRKGRATVGLQKFGVELRRLKATQPNLKVYALGGIDGGNAASCRRAGADGVAVIGAAMEPLERARLLDALKIARRADS